jgi:hypothetical protein
MRRNINPRVLITQWPPPSGNLYTKEWNPERFSAWVRYTMEAHNMRNQNFVELGMDEQTIISMKTAKAKPRPKTLYKFVKCIMAYNANGRTQNGLLKEASMNMKDYKKTR